jgi:hypothetical protein
LSGRGLVTVAGEPRAVDCPAAAVLTAPVNPTTVNTRTVKRRQAQADPRERLADMESVTAPGPSWVGVTVGSSCVAYSCIGAPPSSV